MNKIIDQLKKIKLPNQFLPFLALLLGGDALFIILHISHKLARLFDLFSTIRKDVFNLSMDLGLAESFQYVKEFWIVILLAWLIIKNKQYAYTGWALLFTYLLFDDMLSFHEGLATFFLKSFGIDPFFTIKADLRYQDFGELGASIFFGILFLSLIVLAYFRSDQKIRSTFYYLIGGLLFITFFGVAFDFMNRIVGEDTKTLYELTRLIEDGGEMIGMSLTCWYVFVLANTSQLML